MAGFCANCGAKTNPAANEEVAALENEPAQQEAQRVDDIDSSKTHKQRGERCGVLAPSSVSTGQLASPLPEVAMPQFAIPVAPHLPALGIMPLDEASSPHDILKRIATDGSVQERMSPCQEGESAQQKEPALPIRLSLCFNHVMVAENSTSFKMRLENLSQATFDEVRVQFSMKGLENPPDSLYLKRLDPFDTHDYIIAIEMMPKKPGAQPLSFDVQAQYGAMTLRFEGREECRIMAKPENGPVNINVRDIRIGGETNNIGQEVKFNQLIGTDKTVGLNDIMIDQPIKFIPQDLKPVNHLTIPPHFHKIVSPGKVLRLCLNDPKKGWLAGPRKECLADPKAKCLFDPAQCCKFTLVARDEFKLGRQSGTVDFVTRFSSANKDRTMLLGRIHLEAHILNGVPQIRDAKSTNGTTLGDKAKLEPLAWKQLTQGAVLILGGEYQLQVEVKAPASPGLPAVANIHCWEGPPPQSSNGNGAVCFRPLNSEKAGREAVWVFSDASFGSDPVNAIVLDFAGVAKQQGRIYYFSGCFWIANNSNVTQVELDEQLLKVGQIAPLATGQKLRIGKSTYRVLVTE